MKFDLLKVINAIVQVMAVVEAIKGAGGGKAKADAVIEATPALISAVELGLDKDLLKQDKVQEAERALLTAVINFRKAIDAAKQAKGTGGSPQ